MIPSMESCALAMQSSKDWIPRNPKLIVPDLQRNSVVFFEGQFGVWVCP